MVKELRFSSEQLDFLEKEKKRFPMLSEIQDDVFTAYKILEESFAGGGKLLICGNGGSAADSEHIVGELMKGFEKKRPLRDDIKTELMRYPEGSYLAKNLQEALPAINLSAHTSLFTAFSNDVSSAGAFAQQVLGYGRYGDVLLGISTSGNSENVVMACVAAKAAGLKVVALTGEKGGRIAELSDAVIRAPGAGVRITQDAHSVIYHILCVLLEMRFWPD